jgi:hypothetical protein
VPITPTNQIDFSTISDQYNYFVSKAVHVYDKCKYQARTATIRVKGYVDTLHNCNYGFYTNSYNGTNKTFYFWIVAKNFLARETTELTIQIDDFQTWLFDFNFTTCMVERKHVTDDTFGNNTIPEDFELGDYVTYIKKPISVLQGDPCYLVGITDESAINGAVFGKTYTGFELKYFKERDYLQLNQYIQSFAEAGKADAIAFIFTFPDALLNENLTPQLSSGDVIPSDFGYHTHNETLSWLNDLVKNFNFNGKAYTPFNNKIYCYPFNFITVKNSNGGNVVLKLELFSNTNSINFCIDSVLSQNPHITLTPQNYAGKEFAIDDSIAMQDFPLCSWNNDNYSNWYAQHVNTLSAQSANAQSSYKATKDVTGNNYANKLDNLNTNAEKGAINTTLSTLGALGGGNLLGAGSNAVGGASNTFLDFMQGNRNAQNDLSNANLMNNVNYQNSIRSIVASVKDASVQPNTCKGSTASSGLDLARGTATFFIEQTAIKPEYAKIIDMYFQMFGYQVNSVEIPSFRTRSKWNYLKTVNCSTYGNVPHEDLNAINDMFNNGLTIWHNENYMYNYNTENSTR